MAQGGRQRKISVFTTKTQTSEAGRGRGTQIYNTAKEWCWLGLLERVELQTRVIGLEMQDQLATIQQECFPLPSHTAVTIQQECFPLPSHTSVTSNAGPVHSQLFLCPQQDHRHTARPHHLLQGHHQDDHQPPGTCEPTGAGRDKNRWNTGPAWPPPGCLRLCVRLPQPVLAAGSAEPPAGPDRLHPTFITTWSCPYAQRTWIALNAKGIDFNPVFVDLLDKPAWFLKHNP